MSSIRIEAESMTLTGYVVEPNKSFASGRAIVATAQTGLGSSGTVSTSFTGTAGSYTLRVGYYDENDGIVQFTVLVDGTAVESWMADQNLGSSNAAATNFVLRSIAGVTLNANSLIQVQSTILNTGELARLDYIELFPSNAPNISPVANDDSGYTIVPLLRETSLDVNVANGVLSNDTDADGDLLTVAASDSTSAQGGTVVVNTNGSFTYTPRANFSGTDSFTYTISDGKGGTDTAIVSINVAADQVAPTPSLGATDKSIGVGSNDPYVFTVRYLDDTGIDLTTLNSQDIRVTGPNGFNQLATLVSNFTNFDWMSSYRASASYAITAPAGGWNSANSGLYGIAIESNQVSDASGNFITGQLLGSVQLNVLPVTFDSTDGDETLIGNALNNPLNGFGGNDTLWGGTGNNVLNGGDGIDTADYSQSARGVIANLETGRSASALYGALSRPKILPLGDSITAGDHTYPVPGAYRTRLWQQFLTEGLTIDFVGSRSNGPSELGDKDHEGRGGFDILDIRNILTSQNLLNTYQPDVVLLMIGSNDTVFTGPTLLNDMFNDLSSLIDTITQSVPNAHVVVGSIGPLNPSNRGSSRAQLGLTFNAFLPEL
ncbi:MAG: cadherin-like domain-containing protein [Cyanobacteria bacterium CRU_2_1]|nr:cadherin-like domain-containing protein [Cyanobacteria bacterium CRU_2_1]